MAFCGRVGFISGTVVSHDVYLFIYSLIHSGFFFFLTEEAFINTYCVLETVLESKGKKRPRYGVLAEELTVMKTNN